MSHFIRRALIVGRAFRVLETYIARNATPTYDANGSRVNSHKRMFYSVVPQLLTCNAAKTLVTGVRADAVQGRVSRALERCAGVASRVVVRVSAGRGWTRNAS